MSRIELGWITSPPEVAIRASASSGVTTTPIRFEKDAETIAPATLPLAMEVKLMLDCTVDGTRHSHSRPWYSCWLMMVGARTRMPSPSTGKSR